MPFFCPKGRPLQNPYQLLGLEHGATDDEIAKSFKKLMLRLHPDKQPSNQPPEEAEEISRKFHDVKDAKSFLLDGEHLAARRAYDSKLVRAKQEAKVASIVNPHQQQQQHQHQQQQKKPQQQQKKPQQQQKCQKGGRAQCDSMGAAPKSKDTKDDLFAAKSNNVRPASYAKNKNMNIKQWGRSRRKNRVASRVSNRSSAANARSTAKATQRAAPRQSSEGDTPEGNGNSAMDPMKNKTRDSCGECSATDDCSSNSDDEKRKHACSKNAYGNHRPNSNRPGALSKGVGRHLNRSTLRGEPAVPAKNRADGGGANDNKRDNLRGAPQAEPRRHSDTDVNPRSNPPKSCYHPADAARAADYSNFYPAVDTLERQYHCPLTHEIMKEPMSDFEGNSYERVAILKYLETHTTSPVTGNLLHPMHLTPNSALKEKIRYTLKLKNCIDSLQHPAQPPPLPASREQQEHEHQQQPSTSYHREIKYKSLREGVNNFIKDLNSNSPGITIPPLDDSAKTSFDYLGITFLLEVPDCIDNDNVVVQTWFDNPRKSATISARVVQFNAALHKIGLGGSKLTYRNMNGKYAFTLTKKIDPEKFSKTLLRHGIEYFMEMSIKLHNIINSADARKVGKVRLTSANGIAAAIQ